MNDVRISAEAMRTWTVPTTMFLGSLTQGPLREAANYVCTSMPDCKLVMLEGQGHMAAQQAPALFVAKVLESVR